MAKENDVFYYNKEGIRQLTTVDKLHIPEGVYHSIIDNLNETLIFVMESALDSKSYVPTSELKDICEKAIKPYSEAVKKYGYEFFIADISSKTEIVDISCMLREI